MYEKRLIAKSSPRDLSLAEVEAHIVVLSRTYRQSCAAYENILLPNAIRRKAFDEMQRSVELIIGWREVKRDFLKDQRGGKRRKRKKIVA